MQNLKIFGLIVSLMLVFRSNLEAAPGTKIWDCKVDDGAIFSSPAISSEGTVYIADQANNLTAIDNGDILWRFQADDEINSTPTIGPDGTIYFGSYDNNLYALESNGDLKWKFETEGEI